MGLSLSHRQNVTLEQRRDARKLRQDQTGAEALLWAELRGKKLGGLKFRRQQPVCGFVLDFYCESLNLAIELDGSVHDRPDVAARDKEREEVLAANGIRFLRFKNAEIETDLGAVLRTIQNTPQPPPPL